MAINWLKAHQSAVVISQSQEEINEQLRIERAILTGDVNAFLEFMIHGQQNHIARGLEYRPNIAVDTGQVSDHTTGIQFTGLSPIQYAYWVGDTHLCDQMMNNAKQRLSPEAYQEFAATVKRQLSELNDSEFAQEQGESYLPNLMREMRGQFEQAKEFQFALDRLEKMPPSPERVVQQAKLFEQFAELRQQAARQILPQYLQGELKDIIGGKLNENSIKGFIQTIQHNYARLVSTQAQIESHHAQFAERHELPKGLENATSAKPS